MSFLFPFLFTGLFAQNDFHPLPHVHKEPTYDIAPQFPGGSDAMMQYFADSIRFPEPERTQRKQGHVLVKFTVTRKGAIKDVHVINGVAGAPRFVPETVRVLEAMPPWVPATRKKKRVDAEVQLAVPFRVRR